MQPVTVSDVEPAAQDPAARFTAALDGVWLVAAMAAALDHGLDTPFDPADPAAGLLAATGYLEPDGAGLVPVAAFAAVMRGREKAFADGIRSMLGQAATAAFAGGDLGGWSAFSDEILVAQAGASAMMGPLLARIALPRLDGLAERFADHGRILDVGVGGGGLACALCEAAPTATVVGIDVLPRALELAAARVADRRLTGRVELRHQGVQDLDDDGAFDLAWLPLPFIPRPVVAEGLRRVRRALAPGRWLLLPGSLAHPGADGAMAAWQTHLAGGTLLTEDERAQLLADSGFGDLQPLPMPPGAPPVLAARRAP